MSEAHEDDDATGKLTRAVTVRFSDDEWKVLNEQIRRARRAHPEHEITRAGILRGAWRRATLGAEPPDAPRETVPTIGIVPTT